MGRWVGKRQGVRAEGGQGEGALPYTVQRDGAWSAPTSYFLHPTSYFLLPTSYILLTNPASYSLLPTPHFLTQCRETARGRRRRRATHTTPPHASPPAKRACYMTCTCAHVHAHVYILIYNASSRLSTCQAYMLHDIHMCRCVCTCTSSYGLTAMPSEDAMRRMVVVMCDTRSVVCS